MIKKILKILPFIYLYRNFIRNVKLMITNKSLSIGVNSELYQVNFGKHNSIGAKCNLLRVNIGDYSYISSNSFFRDVEIGKFCSIAPNVQVGLGYHPVHFTSTHPVFYSNENHVGDVFTDEMLYEDHKNTIIGHDVWIGANAIILDGVVVGNGAIIAAGSVVSKDVKDYEIVGGIPAKHIKYRFEEATIRALSKLEWWSWDQAKIKANKLDFLNNDTFIKKHK